MAGVNEQTDLRWSCRAFVAAAFHALREEHVIPTPIFHPYVAVGRDYFGDTVRAVAEYHTVEMQLGDAYPERFAPATRPGTISAGAGPQGGFALSRQTVYPQS
jgi:hypothetical protein